VGYLHLFKIKEKRNEDQHSSQKLSQLRNSVVLNFDVINLTCKQNKQNLSSESNTHKQQQGQTTKQDNTKPVSCILVSIKDK